MLIKLTGFDSALPCAEVCNSHTSLLDAYTIFLTIETHDNIRIRGVSEEIRRTLFSQWKVFTYLDHGAFLQLHALQTFANGEAGSANSSVKTEFSMLLARCNLIAAIPYHVHVQWYLPTKFIFHAGTTKDSMVADLQRLSHRAIAHRPAPLSSLGRPLYRNLDPAI